MLTNMFIGNPPGNTDRILDFSTALTGNLFYTPTNDFLDNPPAQPPASTQPQTEQPAAPDPADDQSLGIGGLKPNQG